MFSNEKKMFKNEQELNAPLAFVIFMFFPQGNFTEIGAAGEIFRNQGVT